jgi:ArsR family transcriptional regulator
MELTDTIDESAAVRALAALAQPQRLRAFRALVAAGPDGLPAGAIAEALEVAPSALTFHLKELAHAGLVAQERAGRNLVYRAALDHMGALMDYLTAHCCLGAGCEDITAPSCRKC